MIKEITNEHIIGKEKEKLNYHVNMLAKILTPMDITAALPELEDDFFITAQMTSTTLQKKWRKIYLIRKDRGKLEI